MALILFGIRCAKKKGWRTKTHGTMSSAPVPRCCFDAAWQSDGGQSKPGMFPKDTETWQLGHRKPQPNRQPSHFPDSCEESLSRNDVGPVPWVNLIARFQQPAMFIRTRLKHYMCMVGCAGNLSDMSQPREGRFARCHYRKAVARYKKGVSLMESRHGLTWCGVGSLF